VSEQEKKRFFDEKKIIVNQGIDDNLAPNELPKKPKKKNLAAEKSFLREKSKVSLLSVSGKEPEQESGSFARNDEDSAQDLATKDDARQSGKQAATKQNVSVERQTKIIRENLNPRNDGTNTKKDVGSTFILACCSSSSMSPHALASLVFLLLLSFLLFHSSALRPSPSLPSASTSSPCTTRSSSAIKRRCSLRERPWPSALTNRGSVLTRPHHAT